MPLAIKVYSNCQIITQTDGARIFAVYDTFAESGYKVTQ